MSLLTNELVLSKIHRVDAIHIGIMFLSRLHTLFHLLCIFFLSLDSFSSPSLLPHPFLRSIHHQSLIESLWSRQALNQSLNQSLIESPWSRQACSHHATLIGMC
mmetsp:Transcript_37251/g.74452  ORF Transcript_37251/g.74452 Transcript_37251/m.74452 type:complete len:104 (+) Transcript_37251:369-680(+)